MGFCIVFYIYITIIGMTGMMGQQKTAVWKLKIVLLELLSDGWRGRTGLQSSGPVDSPAQFGSFLQKNSLDLMNQV